MIYIDVGKILRQFSIISELLERVLMEHIESIFNLESKLFFVSIFSVEIRSRK